MRFTTLEEVALEMNRATSIPADLSIGFRESSTSVFRLVLLDDVQLERIN